MHPATRTPAKLDTDANSLGSGLTFDPADDLARPEFEAEADISTMLRRYGVEGLMMSRTPMQYGAVVDYGDDLLAIRSAEREVVASLDERVPAELRSRFPTVAALLDGLASGVLKVGSDGVVALATAPAETAPPAQPVPTESQ